MAVTGADSADPADAGTAKGRRAWPRRRVAAGLGALLAAPVVWYAATRPLGGGAGGIAGPGGPAKGVSPQAGHEAPNFVLRDPAGQTVELRRLRGKAVLLNFWATWCAPCREEMPELEELHREYGPRGLVVLGVSVDESRAARAIPEFLKEGDARVGPYTFPVALDEKQEVMRQYKLLGVPSSYFIDRDGVIRVVQPRVMSRAMMLEGVRAILPDA
jgi:peroxiredoxin